MRIREKAKKKLKSGKKKKKSQWEGHGKPITKKVKASPNIAFLIYNRLILLYSGKLQDFLEQNKELTSQAPHYTTHAQQGAFLNLYPL